MQRQDFAETSGRAADYPSPLPLGDPAAAPFLSAKVTHSHALRSRLPRGSASVSSSRKQRNAGGLRRHQQPVCGGSEVAGTSSATAVGMWERGIA
jgi:hypothetical protein